MDASPYVHACETHTGTVVLVGDRAYKAKRPVRTDFLDFTTAAAREQACARELELNSRLAPQAYLGLAHLTGPGQNEVEPVLVMRRYPDALRLSSRVRAGADGLVADVERVAAVLADFHADARRGRDVDAEAKVLAVTARWDDNLVELHGYADEVVPAATVTRIGELAKQFISGRAVLFADRITLRRIVDGHADLLADDIFCADDGPVLLDCLDFDDKLRFIDGIDDAAFLAMDLEFLGRPDLAETFFTAYCRRAAESAPAALRHFYIAYRAVVRAKVDCIRFTQGHLDARADARRHLDIALEHLRAAIPRLILIGGGPGTGKTTLARSLGQEIGAQVISTDDVRKEMVANGLLEGEPGDFERGLYTPENVAAVYRMVLRRAQSQLAAGESVILDGTWRDAAERAQARELAEKQHAVLFEMACTTPLATARERISQRVGSSSDATAAVASAIDAEGEDDDPWAGLPRVDTAMPLPDSVAAARQLCVLGF